MDLESWLTLKNALSQIALGCIVMFLSQQVCMWSIKQNAGSKSFRILIYPFVFMHELAHYLMAFLMGFSNIRLQMYCDSSGRLGSVSYLRRNTVAAYVGSSFTALAPIIMGCWVLYLLCTLIGIESIFSQGVMLTDIKLVNVWIFIKAQNPLYLFLGMYVFCGTCIAMSPSIQDYKMSISGLFAIATFIVLILSVGTKFNTNADDWLVGWMMMIANIILVGGCFTLITTICVLLTQPIFSLLRKRNGDR